MSRKNKKQEKKNKQEKREARHKFFNKKNSVWLDHFKKFNIGIGLKNLYLKDIEGDGNCLFRSISD
jgi:hypothetical protein